MGQADRAADGPGDTRAALSRAQVEVLLLTDGADDGRTGPPGEERATGPVPPENQPGHHPEHEQDKPRAPAG